VHLHHINVASNAEISKNFANKAQNYYCNSIIQQQTAQILLQNLPINNYQLVLDAGCGDSIIARQLQKNKQHHWQKLLQLDFALSMLQNWQNKPSNIINILANIYQLPFKDNVFDLVISSFVLQWLNEIAIDNLAKITKKGAVLAIAFPNSNSLQNLSQIIAINKLPSHDFFCHNMQKNNLSITKSWQQNLQQNFDSLAKAIDYFKIIGANTKTTSHHNFYALLKQKKLWQLPFCLDWCISFFICIKQ